MIFRTQSETESNKKLQEVAVRSLVCEVPNCVLVFISAILSASMIIWVDFLGSFSAVLHSLFVFLITQSIEKNEQDSYRFDSMRLETMASLICDVLMIGSYITLLIAAVYKIIHPSRINEAVYLYFVVKITDILFDVYFYRKQKSIYENDSSKINETELAYWKNSFLADTLIGLLSVGTYLLMKYEWSWRINPIVSVLLSVFFVCGSINRIKESVGELFDKALPVPQQDKVIDALLEQRRECLQRMDDVKIFRLNNKIHVVIKAKYKDTTTFQQQLKLLKDWNGAVQKIYPESVILVEIEN